MKKILHIIDTTGPGGAETVFVDLLSGIPRDRFQSEVLIRGDGWVCDELHRRGFEPHILPAKGSFNWRYLRSLVNLIRRHDIDLIQTHLLGSAVYGNLAGCLSGRPVISTFHGSVDISQVERFMRIKFGAIKLGCDRVIAVSDSLRDDLVQRTPIGVRSIDVIYNGIDTSVFRRDRNDAVRARFGWQDDITLIGCLGNIREAKGYDVLLRAAAELKSDHPELRFVIAGQGKRDLDEHLASLSSDLGLDDTVRFLGFCEAPAEFLNALDLFLLPSTSEGFSIATIQAMAVGLPVIATRSGGPEEIISHHETGYLVEAGDPSSIVRAVNTLIDDEELRAGLARAGHHHATSTFSIDAMISSYVDVYESVL